MTRLRSILASLWTRLRWRRRLLPLALPPGTVVADVRLVVHRDPAGKLSYVLRGPDGEHDPIALTTLFTAVADMGMAVPGLPPPVRKACRKLDDAMGALRSKARCMMAAERAKANGTTASAE